MSEDEDDKKEKRMKSTKFRPRKKFALEEDAMDLDRPAEVTLTPGLSQMVLF